MKSSDPVGDAYYLAGAYLSLGDALRAKSDTRGAEDAWRTGMSLIPTGATERPVDSNIHAALLQRLGRNAEAQWLTNRLNAMGYRLPI